MASYLKALEEYAHGVEQGRGQGRYAQYKPWLPIRAVKSCAVRSRIYSRKFGRTLHFMSNSEVLTFFQLEWNDEVLEIREQFPLHPKVTNEIASELHLLPAGYSRGGIVMTTDFLVTYKQPSGKTLLRAYQVKASRKDAEHPRTNAKLVIEQHYWRRQSIPCLVVVAEAFNRTFCANLRALFPERNSSYAADDLQKLSGQVAQFAESEPDRLVCSMGMARKFSIAGINIDALSALKILLAHKVWRFPGMQDQKLLNCRLADFEVSHVR